MCDQHRKFLHNVNDGKASHKSFYAQGFAFLREFSNLSRATDAFSQTYSISVSVTKAIFMKNAGFVFYALIQARYHFLPFQIVIAFFHALFLFFGRVYCKSWISQFLLTLSWYKCYLWHLNQKSKNKTRKVRQILRQHISTIDRLLKILQLSVQKMYKISQLCPWWICHTAMSKKIKILKLFLKSVLKITD
jgi:hypothetical protein